LITDDASAYTNIDDDDCFDDEKMDEQHLTANFPSPNMSSTPGSPRSPADVENNQNEKLLPAQTAFQRRRKLYIYSLIALGVAAVLALGASPPFPYTFFFRQCANFFSAALGLGLHFGLKSTPAPAQVAKDSPVSKVEDSLHGPTVDSNFADPSYIEVNNTYYSFATNKYVTNQPGQVHIQIATSTDFENWNLTGQDALPNPGNWSTSEYVWAPDVVQLVSFMFPLCPTRFVRFLIFLFL
jgi:hypothetical protein